MNPSICLNCNNKEFVIHRAAHIEQYYLGNTVWVHADIMECPKCHWQFVSDDQMDELLVKVKKAYAELPAVKIW